LQQNSFYRRAGGFPLTATCRNNAVSGNWTTTADWSPAARPGVTDDLTIAATGVAYMVAVNSAQAAKRVNDQKPVARLVGRKAKKVDLGGFQLLRV
jgi:hypothetical protein